MRIGIKRIKLYLALFNLFFVHLMIILCWIIKKNVKNEIKYTIDFKEYNICSYPKTKNFW